ncbi:MULTISPECIES: trimeric intracellular cation channel family protein [Arenibacter]|uniref:trimeric intracellular cation channel family protein n=1 Tax=Arenibacter TaxID=178469 RepID=UPI00373FE0D3
MMHFAFDVIGTVAFAISGVMVAMDKKLDLFGVFIIAFVTAVGGGTLRDVLIGNTPVLWMQDHIYIYIITVTVILSILLRSKIKYVRTSIFLFDSIGIGFYTLLGITKGLSVGLSPVMCIALGTMTACFGGVIRDILCNEIPVIFRKEIYATACISGGISFFLIRELPIDILYAEIFTILIIIGIRLWAVKYHISLPNIYRSFNTME